MVYCVNAFLFISWFSLFCDCYWPRKVSQLHNSFIFFAKYGSIFRFIWVVVHIPPPSHLGHKWRAMKAAALLFRFFDSYFIITEYLPIFISMCNFLLIYLMYLQTFHRHVLCRYIYILVVVLHIFESICIGSF